VNLPPVLLSHAVSFSSDRLMHRSSVPALLQSRGRASLGSHRKPLYFFVRISVLSLVQSRSCFPADRSFHLALVFPALSPASASPIPVCLNVFWIIVLLHCSAGLVSGFDSQRRAPARIVSYSDFLVPA
jgi:hypothetical protein